MPPRPFSIIVAATRTTRGIGLKGGLPWRLKAETAYFAHTTTHTPTAGAAAAGKQNAIIMGRKTWEGVPLKYRPLAKRLNIVLTSQPDAFRAQLAQQLPALKPDTDDGAVHVCSSLQQALDLVASHPAVSARVDRVFVIGGGALYVQAMAHPDAAQLLYTRILTDDNLPCDTFFPAIDPAQWALVHTSAVQTEPNLAVQPPTQVSYQYETWERRPATTTAANGSASGSGSSGATAAVDSKSATAPTVANGTATGAAAAGLGAAAVAVTNAVNGLTGGGAAAKDSKTATASSSSSSSSSSSAATAAADGSVGNAEEQQYLDLVRDVIAHGVTKNDRTGVGTRSKFGALMRFSLRDGRFPLLTTKSVYWKGVVEELLWMLRGCTDATALSAKKVKIWDDNGSRAFLDKLGFTDRAVGDLGPVYGFQWRHFGAKYVDTKTDYTGQGVDQIADVLRQLRTNPDSRRILFSAWNPADLGLMALPPCHVSAQFTVAGGELSCLLYQRSCDLGLGVPFNVASYALLTVLMAHAAGLKPGEFVHTLGDYHVYLNHIEPLREQLARTPRAFPTLRIRADCAPKTDVADYTMADLELTGYNPYGAVKMAMAV